MRVDQSPDSRRPLGGRAALQFGDRTIQGCTPLGSDYYQNRYQPDYYNPGNLAPGIIFHRGQLLWLIKTMGLLRCAVRII